MRVKELAASLGLPFEGEGEVEVSQCAPIESAGPGDLSFIGNAKGARAAASSQATCLIVPVDFAADRTVIRAPEPRAEFGRAIRLLHPVQPPPPGVHPSAVVDPGAKLGDRVSVGPHCTVARGVEIGDDCVLYSNVTIYSGVRIGPRSILHAGVVLGADGFGYQMFDGRYEKFPQVGRVEIGADVEIGANSCVDRAALGVTRIGDGTKLDNMVHIGHNCTIGKHVVIAAQTGLAGGVEIGDCAIIGGQVGIGDKAKIEARAVVGSGAGILTGKIVRAGSPQWGTPAQPLHDHLEQLAHLRKLGELRREVAELKRRLDNGS